MKVALFRCRSLGGFVIFRTIALPLLGPVLQRPPIRKVCTQCQPKIQSDSMKDMPRYHTVSSTWAGSTGWTWSCFSSSWLMLSSITARRAAFPAWAWMIPLSIVTFYDRNNQVSSVPNPKSTKVNVKIYKPSFLVLQSCQARLWQVLFRAIYCKSVHMLGWITEASVDLAK